MYMTLALFTKRLHYLAKVTKSRDKLAQDFC